jgi:hypothetical protein
MKGHITGLDGAYCPIPAPHILKLRLAKGRYLYTDLGLEMKCNTCDEYYPADTEFFFPQPNHTGGLHGYCKDCYLIRTGRGAKGGRRGRAKLHRTDASLSA